MRRRKALSLAVLAAVWLLVGCQGAPEPAPESAPAPEAVVETVIDKAARLAQEILIVDTHVDVPYRLVEQWEDISVRTEKGDFDFPRAQAGGLNAPFMSIYVPASFQETGGAKEKADELIDMVEKFTTDWPDKFALARSPADLEAHFAAGKISLPMGIENGAPIEDDLGNVGYFFDRGIRYVTLTHGKNNQICDSSYEPGGNRKWKGLSPFGREVVAEMNRVGMMIDVSHVSDAAFDQVIELSAAPVIASHSSCRKFTPGFERNLDDERIRRLGENGGVIQINFGSAFLTQAANEHSKAQWAAFGEHLKANNIAPGSDQAQAFMKSYQEEHPMPYAEMSDVVAHIDHVVELVGVDHVGLGSDFDGVGDSLPAGLKDVSGFPNLIAALLESGYSEEDVRKICGGNLVRVWTEVERVAAELQSSPPAPQGTQQAGA